MEMNFNLNLTQEQKLIMTQQMQLSIKLLQMSTNDLREYIEKEFLENPVLEVQYESLINLSLLSPNSILASSVMLIPILMPLILSFLFFFNVLTFL